MCSEACKRLRELHLLQFTGFHLPHPCFTAVFFPSPEQAHHILMHCVSPHQVVTAMGRTWHPEHFVCTHCQDEIGSRNFFERDGLPYCEKDYHSLFSPRCHYCNGPILDVSNAFTHLCTLKHIHTHIANR